MGQRRTERVASLLLEEVSQILVREIKDPRIGMVSLTGVRVSEDLKFATVYFTTFPSAERERALAGLESASRYIKTHISRRLKLRYTPELHFTYDPTSEQAERVDSLLKQIANSD
jgi:ribosome-binding factor A